MKKVIVLLWIFVGAVSVYAQDTPAFAKATERSLSEGSPQEVVIVTGARFSYPLVQRWIDEFTAGNPEIQIIIESRGSADPAKFDVLAEVYEQDRSVTSTRQYVYTGRYAVVPVAKAGSEFAIAYGKKGLNQELIRQIFFHDVFAEKSAQEKIKSPYTVYTRLQKAGVPIVFANYFGFQQKDIKGKTIAGSDEHLLKALLRDSSGVSFLPVPVAYDAKTGKPVAGVTVLPVDLDGNGRVTDDERIFDDRSRVLQQVGTQSPKNIKNLPVQYLHLSVDKTRATPSAIAFVKWVAEHGGKYLADYGYLAPEPGKSGAEQFTAFAAKAKP